ncbi:hypothetical protein [Thalassomonas actiniarum]|uniref:Uncharacterized protein n=1 Tax=Thalassomonas actiniarum TaxID=485447 RepID=A0AAF0C3P5_9GAMM|nr:hypothetical protein [Thalassomonas actiniarum]WDD99188.1 hypothetical protein SG35_000415 [Thalassomonas actiniarum]
MKEFKVFEVKSVHGGVLPFITATFYALEEIAVIATLAVMIHILFN